LSKEINLSKENKMIKGHRFKIFQWLELPKNCLVEVKHYKTGELYTFKNVGTGKGRHNKFYPQGSGMGGKIYNHYWMNENFKLIRILKDA